VVPAAQPRPICCVTNTSTPPKNPGAWSLSLNLSPPSLSLRAQARRFACACLFHRPLHFRAGKGGSCGHAPSVKRGRTRAAARPPAPAVPAGAGRAPPARGPGPPPRLGALRTRPFGPGGRPRRPIYGPRVKVPPPGHALTAIPLSAARASSTCFSASSWLLKDSTHLPGGPGEGGRARGKGVNEGRQGEDRGGAFDSKRRRARGDVARRLPLASSGG
jgi:hypothetical protein